MNLEQVINKLIDLADVDIGCMIMDAQDKCEQECLDQDLPPDDWAEYNDGETIVKQPIVYPENACPELDNARTLIWEAIEQLAMYTDNPPV